MGNDAERKDDDQDGDYKFKRVHVANPLGAA